MDPNVSVGYAVDGFIDYDPDGQPFMGLLVSDAHVQLKIYLSHREGARKAAKILSDQLDKMAGDLIVMPNKLAEAGGTLDGFRHT